MSITNELSNRMDRTIYSHTLDHTIYSHTLDHTIYSHTLDHTQWQIQRGAQGARALPLLFLNSLSHSYIYNLDSKLVTHGQLTIQPAIYIDHTLCI